MVAVGLMQALVVKMLPSMMNRLLTSWARPQRSTTELAGSSPIRAVPSRCQPALRRSLDDSTCRAPEASITSVARAMPCSSILSVFSLRAYSQRAPGMPWLSVSPASRTTRLCSSGKSSVITVMPTVWPYRSPNTS